MAYFNNCKGFGCSFSYERSNSASFSNGLESLGLRRNFVRDIAKIYIGTTFETELVLELVAGNVDVVQNLEIYLSFRKRNHL